ncbi:MAG: hypothetical protein NXI00_11055 [Cytophagales bacterium]|nr:hypothetical protein [Cytophagales bacterium]
MKNTKPVNILLKSDDKIDRQTIAWSEPHFTKGEWHLQTEADSYTNIIRCKNEKADNIFISSCAQSSSLESQANAQLIASAPDLLEALQDILICHEKMKGGGQSIEDVLLNKAYAAITKALTIQEKSIF